MKITVKTTQQKVFQLEANPEDTVATLKQKIFETQNHPIDVQKLIYSGKILTDDKSVESCGIKEKDFLVLMVSKPKPTPTPMPPAASSSTPVSPPVAAPEPPAAQPQSQSQPQPQPQPQPQAEAPAVTQPAQEHPNFGDSFLSGATLQSTIDTLVNGMGFPREDVMRAMRASFNNPDRAVEYLTNGIPSGLEGHSSGNSPAAPAPAVTAATPVPAAPAVPAVPPSNQPQNLFQLAQQQQQQQQQAGVGAAGRAGAVPSLDLAALRDNPQIQQLRDLVAQNPGMIQPLIQQLAASNPALAQMIAHNPEAIYQLLAPDGAELGEGDIPPGAHVLSVTPEERAAIERLEALGFPRQAAIEAYFACDKNEELAANYLFESSFDDD